MYSDTHPTSNLHNMVRPRLPLCRPGLVWIAHLLRNPCGETLCVRVIVRPHKLIEVRVLKHLVVKGVRDLPEFGHTANGFEKPLGGGTRVVRTPNHVEWDLASTERALEWGLAARRARGDVATRSTVNR